jgi:hypothetical protein
MVKNKRDSYFGKISEYKTRFEKLETEVLKKRLNNGSLIKEAAIAIQQLLEERGEV